MVGAYELRKHLAKDHGVTLRGLAYDDLVAIHEDFHAADEGHQPALWSAPPIEDVDTRGRT